MAFWTTDAFARSVALPAVRDKGGQSAAGFAHGFGGGPVDRQALLAEALGISEEDLEAAQQAALEAAVAEALEAGALTEEQAERILEGARFFRGHGLGRGFRLGGAVDYRALLAGELGITVEELEAAELRAHDAAVDLMLEEGILTEDQALRMQAGIRLKAFIDKDEIKARAIGVTVEELLEARERGMRLSELLEEQGLELSEYRENVAAAIEQAVDDAVAAGVLSAEQAEALEEGGPFWGPGGKFRGGRFHGPRHNNGGPNRPESPSDTNTLDA